MGIRHKTLITGTNNASKQISKERWNEILAGWRADSISDLSPETNKALDSVITCATSKTIAAADDDAASADQVWPAKAIIASGSGTAPKIDVNGDGNFQPERIVGPGDVVRPQYHSPNTNSETTVVRVCLPGRSFNWSVTTSASTYDTDADAFFAAHGTGDSTFKTAWNNYVVGLKSDSIWTKIAAVYPYFGTTAAEQKWNAKDPRDLDAAFRITWGGTKTHDANGFTGDGSSGYGNTHFTPTDFTSADSGGLAMFNKTDASSAMGYDSGRSDGADAQFTGLIAEYGNGNAYGGFGTGAYNCNVAAGDSRGFWIMNRNGSSNTELWHDGTKVKDIADTVSLGTGIPIFVGCSNKNGTPTYFSPKNQALFVILKDGLSSGNIAAFTSRTATYLAAIGR